MCMRNCSHLQASLKVSLIMWRLSGIKNENDDSASDDVLSLTPNVHRAQIDNLCEWSQRPHASDGITIP